MGKPVLPMDYDENGDRGPLPNFTPQQTRSERMRASKIALTLASMEHDEQFREWEETLERKASQASPLPVIGPERQLAAFQPRALLPSSGCVISHLRQI